MSRLAVAAAFIRRDWQTDLSYRAAFGLEIAGLVLTLAIFFYLGRVIDNQEFSSEQGLDGGYFGFVAVGLALFQIIRASLASFSRKLRDEQTTGTFEALLATPASPSLIILASAAYDLIRATVTGVVLIGVAVLLFGLSLEPSVPDLGLALLALAGCIGLFVSLGVAVAAFTVVYKRAIGLLGIILGGLALLGGVYFPISVFPARSRRWQRHFPSPGASTPYGRASWAGPSRPRSCSGSGCRWRCWCRSRCSSSAPRCAAPGERGRSRSTSGARIIPRAGRARPARRGSGRHRRMRPRR